MKKLTDLLRCVDFETKDEIRDIRVNRIITDSRLVEERDLFVAIRGARGDGHDFVKEASRRGAAAIMVEDDVEISGAARLKVDETRRALSAVAKIYYGEPSKNIKVIGVTGTNGKTTVTYLLEGILKAAGFKVGVIGTVRYKVGCEVSLAQNTTPSPIILQSLLARMVEKGLDYCVMEVSSHSLDQKRVEGIDFHAAIFTNATNEHLDYHKDFKSYLDSKKKLFSGLSRSGIAVINKDDASFADVKDACRARSIKSFGIAPDSDFIATGIKLGIEGSDFTMNFDSGSIHLKTKLIGRHNISNILAASSCAALDGIIPASIKIGIENAGVVPGRLQALDVSGVKIFVDYAHTDDALEKVLACMNELKTGRIITVFGCGGDRDRTKRPRMGDIATRLSDYVVITSDNPRDEDPDAIFDDITKGISKDAYNYDIIPDRRDAIAKAISYAKNGDTVLIAGKGHEKYQIVKEKKLPFDDVEIATELAREKSGRECLT